MPEQTAKTEEAAYKVMRLLQAQPDLSQRELAQQLGMSLGGLNYCLKALMDILLDLVGQLRHRLDVGFLFVGRGSDAGRLRATAEEQHLDNVLFYDEIHPDEIPDLYAQCSAGIVALDPRHKSHNIPGKFLTYMQSGLPVLANVNAGNDLVNLIRDEQVGQVCETNQVAELLHLTDKLLAQIDSEAEKMPARCRKLFEREFAVERTVRQIVAALRP